MSNISNEIRMRYSRATAKANILSTIGGMATLYGVSYKMINEVLREICDENTEQMIKADKEKAQQLINQGTA